MKKQHVLMFMVVGLLFSFSLNAYALTLPGCRSGESAPDCATRKAREGAAAADQAATNIVTTEKELSCSGHVSCLGNGGAGIFPAKFPAGSFKYQGVFSSRKESEANQKCYNEITPKLPNSSLCAEVTERHSNFSRKTEAFSCRVQASSFLGNQSTKNMVVLLNGSDGEFKHEVTCKPQYYCLDNWELGGSSCSFKPRFHFDRSTSGKNYKQYDPVAHRFVDAPLINGGCLVGETLNETHAGRQLRAKSCSIDADKTGLTQSVARNANFQPNYGVFFKFAEKRWLTTAP